MSIWGKLAGAAAGLAIGGPIGALLGGVAGHYVIDRDKEEDGPAENQVAFTVGVIALGAKMAKADGVVTMDEVNAFKEVFKVPEGEMKNVARVFNLAKQDVAGYEAYAEQLATMFKGNRKLLEDVLEVTPNIDNDALKAHYRKHVADNHPDKLIARGVPKEFVSIATEKVAAINEAYDQIAKERGM
jgi:DnaJ like chaperone protein